MIKRIWIWVAGVLLVAGGGTAVLVRRSDQLRLEYLVVAAIWLAWLTLVFGYYVWAIRRYSVNYGLTDEEWKIACPALYAEKGEVEEYERLRQQAASSAPREAEPSGQGEAAIPEPAIPFRLPTRNPYASESFGLPPGTLRGTLALTALVMFLSVELVNLFNPGTEERFKELIYAFEMVLAFYFGSRAAEMLWSPRRPSMEWSEAGVARREGGRPALLRPVSRPPPEPELTEGPAPEPAVGSPSPAEGAATSPAAAPGRDSRSATGT